MPGATVKIDSLSKHATSGPNGFFRMEGVPSGPHMVLARFVGYARDCVGVTVTSRKGATVTLKLTPNTVLLHEAAVTSGPPPRDANRSELQRRRPAPTRDFDTESYAHIEENDFQSPVQAPLSTFAIDVDGASYANVRRFIRNCEQPPVDAVRIEEMINYFGYDDPAPEADSEHPFAVTLDGADAPWRPAHKLLRIGIQGTEIAAEDRPPVNLVFLLDVSGSMNAPDKLPLLKKAFEMLVDQMREDDRVAIVVYAGATGTVLEPTPGSEKDVIRQAIRELEAGGSTAGGAGLEAAYRLARESYVDEGINRVLLATDGDFNVGPSSDAEMIRIIEEKKKQGTFLTVLGFGTGNLKDSKMEQIANHGNGQYHYIDSATEARRVLVSEIGSTLVTIAKDVKIQVEFNPAEVAAYRLIGYENRLMDARDFADDTKDGGELGAGHHVTALYEIVPQGAGSDVVPADSLKYQSPQTEAARSGELLTLKLRYKAPDGDESRLIERPVQSETLSGPRSADLAFASAVAGFGMLLRDSDHRGTLTLEAVRRLADEGRGADPDGYRAGFIALLEDYRRMTPTVGDARE